MKKIAALLLALTTSISAHAADGRWFEIEVLIFTQPDNLTGEVLSNDGVVLNDYKSTKDILSEAYANTLTQACLEGKVAPPSQTPSLYANTAQSSCQYNASDLAGVSYLPSTVSGEEQSHMQRPYVLSAEQLQFKDKYSELRQIGRTVLLHTGWRFAGQSKRNAPKFRIFAGDRIADLETNSPSSTFIDSSYFGSAPVQHEPIWQLDGFMKVHLNHYLYIDSSFLLRGASDTAQNVSGEFSQFRRVISGEIHYFDHPQIGMIVQIRRFNH